MSVIFGLFFGLVIISNISTGKLGLAHGMFF